jgi:hypothetical protein
MVGSVVSSDPDDQETNPEMQEDFRVIDVSSFSNSLETRASVTIEFECTVIGKSANLVDVIGHDWLARRFNSSSRAGVTVARGADQPLSGAFAGAELSGELRAEADGCGAGGVRDEAESGI